MPDPFALIALAMVAPLVAASLRFARAINGGQGLPRSTAFAFGALIACSLVPFCLGFLQLITLFAGLWAAALVAFAVIRHDSSRRTLLIANTIALSTMIACSLMYFGYLCVIGVSSTMEPSGAELTIRSALLAGALLLASAFLMALARIMEDAYPTSKRADHALRPFLVFSLYGICYELLDLVPSVLGIWFPLMPYFLLGGTILLAAFCAVFANASSRLGAEALRESESIALERKRLDQEMRLRLSQARAHTDQLTGLATRRAGQQRLKEMRETGLAFRIAYLDVDGLKEVNDERGHQAGDAFLLAFAERLAKAFPDACAVRWGGDEFLVIGDDASSPSLEKRLEALETALAAEEHDPPFRFSFGVACSVDGDDPDLLLRRADQNMYADKRRKRELGTRRTASEGPGGSR